MVAVDIEPWNGKIVLESQLDLVIVTDASILGWEAYCNGV